MFINDVHKKEEIQNLAISDLKTLGIKYRPKKSRQHAEEVKSRKVFKRPIHFLPVETVTLPSGQQLLVPKIVHELCSFLVMKIDTEGLFRKGGSKNRQKEIMLSLDAGCYLGIEHHEIDVASVLKTFFRELPDPLIPYSFHELFLRCALMDRKQVDATLLACLLLPTVHLNTLAYFMQFLHRVAEYHDFNRMDAYNLAVVIGPTLFPPEEKMPNNATLRMNKTLELFKILIEHASEIGVLNDHIIERIAQTNNVSLTEEETSSIKKKKKRRSGSLTRMFSGLKKIVTHKSEEIQSTPDVIMTPCLTRSAKKRKLEAGGMSAKKRQEVRDYLPHSVLLNVPFTPLRTPVNTNPSGKKKSSIEPSKTTKTESTAKERRMLWSTNKTKNKKPEVSSSASTSSIQRRWSAVSSAAGFKKKKTRNSCIGTITSDKPKMRQCDSNLDNQINDLTEELETLGTQQSSEQADYVRIPKAEYEEIKNRVSAIERRISIELESAPLSQSPITCDSQSPIQSAVEEVNKKYAETLVQAEPLCPTTDQLAKRLSRELKIRRSNENRPIFRSPSARKIGSLRRKEGQKVRLSRTQTWSAPNSTTPKGPRNSMRKQKSNDLQILQNSTNTGESILMPSPAAHLKCTSLTSTSSSFITDKSSTSSIIVDSSGSSWKSAQGFFSTPDIPHPGLDNNCRASLARLRSQNAGMVMAKARLFDNLGDSADSQSDADVPRCRGMKIGAPRTQISRIRTLKMEERRKKSMSPRKRPCKSPGIHRLLKAASREGERTSVLREVNRDVETTPKQMPHIKRSLHVKSPRKLCRTPLSAMEIRHTPMKGSRFVLE